MQPDPDLVVVELRTTWPAREAAERCGRELVERRLAACVQVDGPVTSVYRWQGAVETAAEFRFTCKTTPDRSAACAAAITALHPYDVPELLRVASVASPDYARWVRESVGA